VKPVTVRERLVGQVSTDPRQVLVLSDPATPGDSGSAVSTPDGQFVGLLYASADAGGWGLAMDVSTIRAELDRLSPYEVIDRSTPGCVAAPVDGKPG